jgi:hypothetical protein
MQTALDLQDQNIPTPTVFEGGAKVPLSRGTVLDPIQDSDIVAPGQFCNELLQNLLVRPRLGQRTHVAEVPRAEPFDSRELSLKIPSQQVDNLAAPFLSRKPLVSLMLNEWSAFPDSAGFTRSFNLYSFHLISIVFG